MIYKKKNKFLIGYLCAIYAFVFLCGFLFFVDVDKTDDWQNYASFDFEIEKTIDENGNEVITNLISTPEQLAGMFYRINNSVSADDFTTNSNLNNNTYRLKNSINLSGKTWKCTKLPQNYVFDGCFNTIDNLTISASSGENIGFVSECEGTIQNLIFENVNVYYSKVNTYVKMGAVAGNVGASGKISNVTVTSGKVECIKNTETQSRNVAGIAGRLSGGKIEKCINHASVVNGGHTGGIVGYANSNSKINNCFNYGDISTEAYNCVRMGGIAGEIASNGGTISLCYNEGDMTAYNSAYVAGADIAIGGIVGYCYVKVEKCQNYGNITAGNENTDTVHAGGVVGHTSGVVSNCSNSGALNTTAFQVPTVIDSVLMESYNSSIPIAVPVYTYAGIKATGFFSINYRSYTLSDLYTRAYTGGIVGYSTSTVDNSFNVGQISSTGGKKGYAFISMSGYYSVSYYSYAYGSPTYMPGTSGSSSFSRTVIYDKDYYYGNIAGYCSSATSCFYSSSNTTLSKKLYYQGSHYGYTAMEEVEKELLWGNNYISTEAYYTTIVATDISKIEFYDVFVKVGSSGGYSYFPYFTAKTGLTTLQWTEPYGTGGTTPTVGTNLSNTIWKQNANINNNIPVLKDLYW